MYGGDSELTPRMIRSRAEERLGLEGGTLDAWKEVVKRAATRAIVRPSHTRAILSQSFVR